MADDVTTAARTWHTGQRGSIARARGRRSVAGRLSASAPERDLQPSWGVLPSTAEIAGAVVQASESGIGRTTESPAECRPTEGTSQRVCTGRLVVRIGAQPAIITSLSTCAPNQHGQSHWPVLRLVVMHDAETGLAQQPCWGAMFGPEAVSEQELAEKAMDSLPDRAVILGDRNFGIFSIAYAAQQRGIGVVLRLTDVRARKLAGPISQPGEYRSVWKPSRWDGGARRGWPAEALIEGRLIAARVGRGKSQQWLYIFTTLELSVDEIVGLYGRRWNIETDLRSLKRTVRLHHINAQSEATMEKEILMAVSAYNLVRAVMCLAARRSRLDPRQFSFSHVLNVVEAAWPKLINTTGKKQHDQEFFKVLDLAAQCTLPKRHKQRSFPRLQWRRGGPLRFRKEEN